MRFYLIALLIALSQSAFAQAPVTVRLEDMTWMEVRDALTAGKTTVIVPTGGTEQNGPHLALGKHNFTLAFTSIAIAKQLGDALVAPIQPYVPEGNISPPTGHMTKPGTLSLRPETFAAFLEDTARSLKQHGFRTICFVGEHGASQQVQKTVAQKLSAEWKTEQVKVIHVSAYYDDANGQNAYLASVGEKDPDPQAHGGLADTSEMLAMHPQGVRESLRGVHTKADFDALGADGPSDKASEALGQKLIDLKVAAAVKQIRTERSER